MTGLTTDFDFQALRVMWTSADGKNRYEPAGKRKLIEACQQPGASVTSCGAQLFPRDDVASGRSNDQCSRLLGQCWVRSKERLDAARVGRDESRD